MSPPPYFHDDWTTIYHADCRDVLPTLTADVILTDFPYGIGVDYGDGYEDTTDALDNLIATTVPLLLAAAPVVAITTGIANLWRFPPARWVLCWHQINAVSGTGYWGFNQWQPVLVYGTDPYLRRGLGRRPDVVSMASSPKDLTRGVALGHPCPKPLGPWTRILARLSPSTSDVILDPFVGSGTTLEAAKNLGRRAIGIEQSEAYCRIASSRIAQQVLDLGGIV